MNNSLQYSTGDIYTGTIFTPFNEESPSSLFASENGIQKSSIRHAPVAQNSAGWTDAPDVGKTNLAKADYELPIGDTYILLLLVLLYTAYRVRPRLKRWTCLIASLLCLGSAQAHISSLRMNATAYIGGAHVRIEPEIPSVPDGEVFVCWTLCHDAACTQEITDTLFHIDAGFGTNAVQCYAPSAPGTYYIKTSLRTEGACLGLLDSYYVTPLIVYPSDADIVLSRDAQSPGTSHIFASSSSMKAYAAMRFHSSTLNNPELTDYERYNYFLSFPFDVQLGDIYGFGSLGEDWRICYYDGLGRAQEGFFAERATNWIPLDDTDSVLHAGQGYLLQLNGSRMAASNETIWANSDVATLFFPALAPLTALTTTNVTIPALPESYRCTIDLSDQLGSEADRRNKDSFWRCIGIPGFSSPSSVTGLPFLYEWDPADNSLSVVSSEDFSFAPTHAYLVQNGNAFTWLNLSTPLAAPAAVSTVTTAPSTLFRLDLDFNSRLEDRTYILLSEEDGNTELFDPGLDLSKELNTGRANLYTITGNEHLAANCLPDDLHTRVLPVGIITREDGLYRLSMPQAPQQRTAILIDKSTGTRTLMLPDAAYSVTLQSGTYNDRFYLEIPPESMLPTEIRTNDNPPETTKLLHNGNLYIRQNDHIYNILGQTIR